MSKGFRGDSNRHGLNSQGIPNQRSFGYISGFYKSKRRGQFSKHFKTRKLKDGTTQKYWAGLSDKTAEKREKEFRRASTSGEMSGTKKLTFVPSGNMHQPKYLNMRWGMKPGEGPDRSNKKWGYKEYMYIGQKEGKAVKEEDNLKGITTLSELKKTLAVLEGDFQNGLLAKNEQLNKDKFRYRVYLMHMAFLAMDSPTKQKERVRIKDPKTGKTKTVVRRKKAYPHNGEFQNRKKRVKAQEMLKDALLRNGFTVNKWKTKSNYYGGMREISKHGSTSGLCNPELEVCRDKVTYYTKKGVKSKGREPQPLYRIEEHRDEEGDDYRTVGDHMHNKKLDEKLSKLKSDRQRKQAKGKKKGRKGVRLSFTSATLSGKITKSLNSSNDPLVDAKTITTRAFVSGLDKGPSYTKAVLSNLALATKQSNIPPGKKQQILGHIRNELDIRGMNSREVL